MGEESRGLIKDCDDGFELLPQPSDCVDDEAATSHSPPPIYTQLVCNTPQVGLSAPPPCTDSAWDLLQVDYPFDTEICARELERYLDFTTPLSDSGPSYIQIEPCPSQRNPFSTQSVPLPSFKDSFPTKACPSLAEVCPPTPQTEPSLCHQDPHTIRTSLSPTQSRFFPSPTDPFSSDQSDPSHKQICPFPTQAGISLIQSVPPSHHTVPCLTQAVSNSYQLDPLTTEAGPSHTSTRPSHTQDSPSRSSHNQAGPSHIHVGCLHSKNIASPSYIQTGPCPTQEGPLSTHAVLLSTFTDSISHQPGPSHTVVSPPTSQTSPSLIQSAPFTVHTDPCETQALPSFQQFDVLETQAGPSNIHEGPSHTQARPSHSKNIVRSQTTTVKCKCCNRTFTRKSDLRLHMQTVHAVEPTFFLCDQCGIRYSRQKSLRTHIKNKHSDNKPVATDYECSKCGKKFSTSFNVNRHRKFHCRSVVKQPVSTGECESTLVDVDTHEAVAQTQPDVVEPSLSTAPTELPSDLDNDSNSYACPDCGRNYVLKGSLREHQRLKCGIPPKLSCSQCSFVTNYKSNLNRHMLDVHGSMHPQ